MINQPQLTLIMLITSEISQRIAERAKIVEICNFNIEMI